MRLRLCILAALAFGLLAAPAHADNGAVNDATLARYMTIAAAYWGGPEPVCTSDDGQVIHPYAMLGNDPRPDVAAWAEVGGCRIWLDTDYWPAPPSEQYCNLIAHEWGHLLGHEHSSNPSDLMWPDWTNNVVPGCQVFRPPARPLSSARTQPSKVRRLRASSKPHASHGCTKRPRLHRRGARHSTRRRVCWRRSKISSSSAAATI